jgi:TP901 family phage tail tape measure protein
MSRIDLQVVATGNFGQLQSQLAAVQSQIAQINSGAALGNAAAQKRSIDGYTRSFTHALNASGQFKAKMVDLHSATDQFGRSLERGNLRLGQYFQAGSEYIRRQRGEIRALAREQVRLQQSQVMRTGPNKGIVVTPTGIDEAIHKQGILNEQHRIFRQVVSGGATQLINWGKNTQWAGRQMMVGMTIPLTIFGAIAAKTFMDADRQLTRLAKVYGDASKGMVSSQELQSIRTETLSLAQEISRTMGVAASETLGLAADIAATGREGNELLAATEQAIRLSVLGEVDRTEAMRGTLAIQSVFKKDTDELAESINFLNAVENQTSTTLDDLTTGIVKAGPVVAGLGGEIKDLALMMVAMREGGVPAAEAANAIKSSLASLINPTKQTTALLNEFGIDIKGIVDKNAGDVTGTLMDLREALSGLDDLSRQRSIEQIFGKFQFARVNALLENIGRAGSQTEEVMKIAGMSTIQLATTADRELSVLTESASMRWTRAVEGLKSSLIPIGETFLDVGTKVLGVAQAIIDGFNNMPEGLKTLFKFGGVVTALAGPVIMITGVLANFLGTIVKLSTLFMAFRKGGRGVWEHFTQESIAAKTQADLMTQSMTRSDQAADVLKRAVDELALALRALAPASAAGLGAVATDAAEVAAALGAAEGAVARTGATAATPRVNNGGGGRPNVSRAQQPELPAITGAYMEKGHIRNLSFSHYSPISDLVTNRSDLSNQDFSKLFAKDGTFEGVDPLDVVTGNYASDLYASPGEKRTTYRGSTGYSPMQEFVARFASSGASGAWLPSNGVMAGIQEDMKNTFKVDQFVPEDKDDAQRRAWIAEEFASGNFNTGDRVTPGAITAAGRIAAGEGTARELNSQFQKRSEFIGNQSDVIAKKVALADMAQGDPQRFAEFKRAMTKMGEIGGPAAQAGFLDTFLRETPEFKAAREKVSDRFAKMIPDGASFADVQRVTALSDMAATGRLPEGFEGSTSKSFADRRGLGMLPEFSQYGISPDLKSEAMQRVLADVDGGKAANREDLRAIYTDMAKKAEDHLNKTLPEIDSVNSALSSMDKNVSGAATKMVSLGDAAGVSTQSQVALTRSMAGMPSAFVEQIDSFKKVTTQNGTYITMLDEQNNVMAAVKEGELRSLSVAEMRAEGLIQSAAAEKAARTATTENTAATEQETAGKLSNVRADAEEVLAQEELELAMSKETATRNQVVARLRELVIAGELTEQEYRQLSSVLNILSDEAIQSIRAMDLIQLSGIELSEALLILAQRALGTPIPGMGGAPGEPGVPGGKPKRSMNGQMVGMAGGAALAMAPMMIPGLGGTTAGNMMMGAGMGMGLGSMIPGPWGAAIGGALGAAVPAAVALKDAMQQAATAAIEFSESVNGSAASMNKIAEELGRTQPSERFSSRLTGIAMPEEQVDTGQAIIESESGAYLLERARSLGGEALLSGLGNELKQLTMLQIFTPEEAKAVAMALSNELNNPELGRSLIEGINSIIDEEGKLITDNLARQFTETLPKSIVLPEFDHNAANIDEMLTTMTLLFATPLGIGRMIEGSTGMQYVRENAPLVVAQLDKLREAEALTRESFMNGKLSYKDYVSTMDDIRAASKSASEALLQLGASEVGGDITADMAEIARLTGGEEMEAEFKRTESVVERIKALLYPDDETKARSFELNVLASASYGDMTQGQVAALETMLNDEEQKQFVLEIFAEANSDEQATELIQLLTTQGLSAKFVANVVTRSSSIGRSIDEVYGMLTGIADLPENLQKDIITRAESSPAEMERFIGFWDYANSLPTDNKKEIKTEVDGNEDLLFIKENWQSFLALDPVARKTAIMEVLYTGRFEVPAAPPIQTPNATGEVGGLDASAAASAATDALSGGGSSGGGGGGGSPDTSAIDDQIEAKQKLIEKIQEEREERQKLLDLQKKALDFAMREQDLKNQIANAMAEGRIADAALLKAQLSAEKDNYRDDEDERLRTEEEDDRIKDLEKQIEKLQKEKEDASGGGGGSSGGGGGSGGMSDEDKAALEKRIEFLNNELRSKIEEGSPARLPIEMDIYEGQGSGAFWDSEPIKRWKKEMLALGVPIEEVDRQLESIFDQIVTDGFSTFPVWEKLNGELAKVGIYGESAAQVLPNLFTALTDEGLTTKQRIEEIKEALIDAGMEADEAAKAAETLFKSGKNMDFNLAADNFKHAIKGIGDTLASAGYELDKTKLGNLAKEATRVYTGALADGLSASGALERVRGTLFDSFFTDGIAKGLLPGPAIERANRMADGVVAKLKSKDYTQNVPFVSDYNDDGLPDWLTNAMNNSTTMSQLGVAGKVMVDHAMQGTVTSNISPDSIRSLASSIAEAIRVAMMAGGGPVGFFGTGGMIYGPGGPTEDRVPTMLSNGEYVIRASSVDKYGYEFLDLVNRGLLPELARGGMSRYPSAALKLDRGGAVRIPSLVNAGAGETKTEYNVNVNVNGTNASADDIASKVISELSRRERMNRAVTRA